VYDELPLIARTKTIVKPIAVAKNNGSSSALAQTGGSEAYASKI